MKTLFRLLKQKTIKEHFLLLSVFALLLNLPAINGQQKTERQTISLNGTWQICQGNDDDIPSNKQFSKHTVPVPGLIDLATPAFKEVGTDKSTMHRESFWYKRTFTIDGNVPEFAELLIRKVKYGCSVYLNGIHIGNGARSFTPLYFDATHALKGNGEINELIVRVGGYIGHEATKSYPNGRDFEKHSYFPGIYDDVELVLTGAICIKNVQVAPDLERSGVMVEVSMLNTDSANIKIGAAVEVKCKITETNSGKTVSTWEYRNKTLGKRLKGNQLIFGVPGYDHMFIPIPDAKLWAPDTPFLYTLEVEVVPVDTSLSGDTYTTRFGMRHFEFVPEAGCGFLNGKKTYLTGTNMCIYRFFEDIDRAGLPWDKEWVRKLFRTYKQIGWNSARFSIGPAPDFWYDIADEEGFLIQDEYAIWSVHRYWQTDVTGETLAECFRAWMRNRWNHPCVIIWDAQNETFSKGRTKEAIRRVRGEDLSNRPWDVAWEEQMYLTDPIEFHFYEFGKWNVKKWVKKELPPRERFRDLVIKWQNSTITGGNGLPVKRAVVPCTIMNEYCYLWLNREGDPTQLTQDVYNYFLGEEHTSAQRQELYYRYLGMMTELFRSDRKLAGVMHFAGLLGHFPNNMTGDQFDDIAKLTLNPYFVKYAESSFAPVGIMIDLWEPTVEKGEKLVVPINVINDLHKDWKGRISTKLWIGEKEILKEETSLTIPAIGRESVQVELKVPKKEGKYEVTTELMLGDRTVTCRRLIYVE